MVKFEIVVINLQEPYQKVTIKTPDLANKDMALAWLEYNKPFEHYGIISMKKLKR